MICAYGTYLFCCAYDSIVNVSRKRTFRFNVYGLCNHVFHTVLPHIFGNGHLGYNAHLHFGVPDPSPFSNFMIEQTVTSSSAGSSNCIPNTFKTWIESLLAGSDYIPGPAKKQKIGE